MTAGLRHKTMAFPAALALLCAAAFPLGAQGLLEVAEKQMAAGLTPDARVLVESCLSASRPAERDKALYYQAILTTGPDSALTLLVQVAGRGDRDRATLDALERLGDLAYARGQYREAIERWLSAADRAPGPGDGRRCLVKIARARLRLKQPGEALTVLRQARTLGDGPEAGRVRFYTGVARQMAGDTNGAAEEFLAVYQGGAGPCQIAALARLTAIYGTGDSRTARQWRKRLAESAGGTVFDPGPAPQSAARPAEKQTYGLQLGAFSDRKVADKLVRRVRSLGLAPLVLPPGRDRLIRVRIAGISTKAELDRVSALLRKHRISFRLLDPGEQP
jgi:hypothetical protein